MQFEEIQRVEPYLLSKEEKEPLLTKRLLSLTEHHRKNCPEYRRILESIGYSNREISSYTELPFLPVRLFKEIPLKSMPGQEIVKTVTSSGTTGQAVSRIFLDRTTASNQQKALVKIVSSFTGSKRMPMILIDCPSVLKNRAAFSARGAGILGFSIFGTEKMYALDDEMKLNLSALRDFLDRHRGERILLFGFTFMIWQHFYQELLRLKQSGTVFDLSGCMLIHGGGWKKLIQEAVSREAFHQKLEEVCGLTEIHDYYGMVEQTGCIYMECEYGHLHASVFSDVIVRSPWDFSPLKPGERGILQVLSTIPESYPGHSLLTEDKGILLGEDDCPCGRKGKYFTVCGRLANAEIRGCSDTYAAGF
ncbi:acyl-protein synthetase [Acutalibacter sp. 1XD8-33]|uniref:LuxE/PaaK family acyltransferase n=1 Tax=Acutalibacter sp. 1XD8-33 TaxID=2320081 RepID=UPI000EA255B2|nr:acyl-protein synthetase [Acutalibacter sp. 1XD8-33]RKJ41998.1 acyl-protein synthetase [Acutalibacter sp. 1XD8-33]